MGETLKARSVPGKTVLQPDFQRQYVWDRRKASRLVESVLLRVPLPIIYLSEQPDGKEYVIDGQQRLTSLFSFIDAEFNRAITLSTSAEEMVMLRFDRARQWIEGTLRGFRQQPRCFTRELKRQLFERNPTCALCNQGICEVDDAALITFNSIGKADRQFLKTHA